MALSNTTSEAPAQAPCAAISQSETSALPDFSLDPLDPLWPDFISCGEAFILDDICPQNPAPEDSGDRATSASSTGDYNPPSTTCACSGTLQTSGALLNDRSSDIARLDEIVARARQVFDHIQSIQMCNSCDKSTVIVTMAILLSQRLGDHFCKVAKNPKAFFTALPMLRLGDVALSEEEDKRCKAEIVISNLKVFAGSIDGLTEMVKYQVSMQQEAITPRSSPQPRTATLNGQWIEDSLRHLQQRIQLIRSVLTAAINT
ncbi:hypothetical protein PV11_08676 [Exophiala sideris]|uniref:Aflatoxin regulatory protein domain-containing protein n=1 Tax=Exophiala sideris TaxID=1016849 RepID=A0A0D1VLF6_9EURO|nr:hypothetical protein PV11_08676 [Exophiala sideris]